MTSGAGAGQTVKLVQLSNITLEDVGASVVSRATLHVNVAPSPYTCLNGEGITVFSFEGHLFLHNGLEGRRCVYGTWEVAPASVATPGQLPAIAKAYIALSPVVGPPPYGYGRVSVLGRYFGSSAGLVSLIGYSPKRPVPSWPRRGSRGRPAT